ncbi:uncharacterized protein METZ01_LOCUS282882, partial [marine metagenome]
MPCANLFAPGSGILTTNLDGDYRSVSGSSFSAPMVAGSAALIKERFGFQIPPAEVIARIENSVDTKSAFLHTTSSGGRLNLQRALSVFSNYQTWHNTDGYSLGWRLNTPMELVWDVSFPWCYHAGGPKTNNR